MTLSGNNLIGFEKSSEGTVAIQAINPTNGSTLGPLFYKATENELNWAAEKAKNAFQVYRKKSGVEKAIFLEAIASEIENLGTTLIERYVQETALPQGRAEGERGRTCGQLRLFASLLREGSWVNATIDPALPQRTPLPRADIRSMERPLGPVAVFGASNFPLAFSVAGGDTAAALAAGCPVIFKGHPAHLGTSELVGLAIQKAAKDTNMPDGVFSLLFDDGIEIGQLLVSHPIITAVGFTGSFRGGKAIFDTANKRPVPIPVYAEMGSTNPVFILPKTLKENRNTLAKNYLASVSLGVGQFCTNPGLLLIENDPEFKKALQEEAGSLQGGVMLTNGIKNAYQHGISSFKKLTETVLEVEAEENSVAVAPTILHTSASNFLLNQILQEEVFGPSSLVVEGEKTELLQIAASLDGHLTATVHGSEEELAENIELLELLEQKVGRIIINGFPTGVEVCHAMVHGGPFPATTNSRSTSVGTQAITRFTRAVCFQSMPDSLLPDELKAANPLGIWRKTNGEIGKV